MNSGLNALFVIAIVTARISLGYAGFYNFIDYPFSIDFSDKYNTTKSTKFSTAETANKNPIIFGFVK